MINYLDEISKLSYKLPYVVLQDIDKRCTDWMASGGKSTDPYIKQQLRFAENFIKRKGNEIG